MSVKYDSTNYDAASKKYAEIADKYTGANGFENAKTLAKETASDQANRTGQLATANALSAARSNGMSRSKAIASSAGIGGAETAKAYNSAYDSNFDRAATMNNNAVSVENQKVANAIGLDDKKYDAKKTNATIGANIGGAVLGVAGDIASAAAAINPPSDINLKNVNEQTDADRFDQLLKRLRGENGKS